jgi:hypothetical protein
MQKPWINCKVQSEGESRTDLNAAPVVRNMPIQGYLDFMGDKELIHNSGAKFFRSVYAKVCAQRISCSFSAVSKMRQEVLSRLEIKDNNIILETGMGPAKIYG